MEMRLQKFLARAGVASRRACVDLIAEGRVSVNGEVAPPTGCIIDPAVDVVCFDGKECSIPEERVVIALNKPCGYASAMSDARGARLASDLLPTEKYPGLFHVGRLDVDTEGLLLFTNDGELGNSLLHPSKGVWKRYVARVEGVVTEKDRKALEQGVVFDGRKSAKARCRILDDGADECGSLVELEVHEGRKHQVRKMLSAVGHDVVSLRRTAFGPIALEDLPSGSWRLLEPREIDALNRATGCQ